MAESSTDTAEEEFVDPPETPPSRDSRRERENTQSTDKGCQTDLTAAQAETHKGHHDSGSLRTLISTGSTSEDLPNSQINVPPSLAETIPEKEKDSTIVDWDGDDDPVPSDSKYPFQPGLILTGKTRQLLRTTKMDDNSHARPNDAMRNIRLFSL